MLRACSTSASLWIYFRRSCCRGNSYFLTSSFRVTLQGRASFSWPLPQYPAHWELNFCHLCWGWPFRSWSGLYNILHIWIWCLTPCLCSLCFHYTPMTFRATSLTCLSKYLLKLQVHRLFHFSFSTNVFSPWFRCSQDAKNCWTVLRNFITFWSCQCWDSYFFRAGSLLRFSFHSSLWFDVPGTLKTRFCCSCRDHFLQLWERVFIS